MYTWACKRVASNSHIWHNESLSMLLKTLKNVTRRLTHSSNQRLMQL